MPRRARRIFPGIPHHVTHRGNHRQQVFFERGDPLEYLRLLRERAQRHGIELVAYCLMPNHVHLVVVPSSPEGLHLAMKVVHGRYAQRVNRMRGLAGHLWQGRFYSSALDETHFLNAVRYVEQNPVRAGMVERADAYEWSSARAHCMRKGDALVAGRPGSPLLRGIPDWSAWLRRQPSAEMLDTLRRNVNQNLPCGSDEFIARLEAIDGRPLRFRPRGRPRKSPAEARGNEPSAQQLRVAVG